MKNIELKQPVKIWRFRWTKTLKRQLAEEWNELTPRQVERIMQILYTPAPFHVSMQRCMKVLLRLGWIQFFVFIPEMKKLWIDDKGNMVTFLRLYTAFIFNGFSLTQNPFPILKCKGKKLYGPLDYCENMTAEEFITADGYFADYNRSKEVADLDKLVATLYRPAGQGERHKPKSPLFCGEIREGFNDKRINSRLRLVAKIPLARKWAVLSFYRSCRDIWESTFDHVFTGQGKTGGYGWFEILKAVNPADFGTIEQKEKTPIGNILLSMQIDIRDAKEAKRRAKQQSHK